jgi:hypothetical protein
MGLLNGPIHAMREPQIVRIDDQSPQKKILIRRSALNVLPWWKGAVTVVGREPWCFAFG